MWGTEVVANLSLCRIASFVAAAKVRAQGEEPFPRVLRVRVRQRVLLGDVEQPLVLGLRDHLDALRNGY